MQLFVTNYVKDMKEALHIKKITTLLRHAWKSFDILYNLKDLSHARTTESDIVKYIKIELINKAK